MSDEFKKMLKSIFGADVHVIDIDNVEEELEKIAAEQNEKHEKESREAIVLGLWFRGCDGSCRDGSECNSRDEFSFLTTGCANVEEYKAKAFDNGMPKTAVLIEAAPLLDGLKVPLAEYFDRAIFGEENDAFHSKMKNDKDIQDIIDVERGNVTLH